MAQNQIKLHIRENKLYKLRKGPFETELIDIMISVIDIEHLFTIIKPKFETTGSHISISRWNYGRNRVEEKLMRTDVKWRGEEWNNWKRHVYWWFHFLIGLCVFFTYLLGYGLDHVLDVLSTH